MTPIDIIILIIVFLTLGAIIYFNIIRPKIKHESGCSKCPYSKQCCNKAECENNKIVLEKNKTELEKTETK